MLFLIPVFEGEEAHALEASEEEALLTRTRRICTPGRGLFA
jgi:hypothetical protein